ncbi:MAG TPA: 1,4-dihydroxy-2-naphthoate polyprenyltransferase [Thermoanaerobaculia bacterium]|nr:1,4-dihydroxy-2-naphthoate polyprenyltransferase [Thermoanaerobaculia bacterium]
MMNPWLLAARPKTLSASVVPVLVGTYLANEIDWFLFACALIGAVFIQIGTNLVNDALDFRRGADTSARLGPLRVTQAGLLGYDVVMRGAYVCLAIASVCGVPLVVRGGWPVVAIGVASLITAYAYTGGPYPLGYHGLGDLFVLIFFGLVAVGGSFYVQTLTITPKAIASGVAVGLLAVALLAINNLRDVASDRASGKRTLVVRFGETFGKIEIAACVLIPFGVAVFDWVPLIALPLAIVLIRFVWISKGTHLNRCLAMAGALQWAFGILFVIGTVV